MYNDDPLRQPGPHTLLLTLRRDGKSHTRASKYTRYMYNDDPLQQPGPHTRSYTPKRWQKPHTRTHTLEGDKGHTHREVCDSVRLLYLLRQDEGRRTRGQKARHGSKREQTCEQACACMRVRVLVCACVRERVRAVRARARGRGPGPTNGDAARRGPRRGWERAPQPCVRRRQSRNPHPRPRRRPHFRSDALSWWSCGCQTGRSRRRHVELQARLESADAQLHRALS